MKKNKLFIDTGAWIAIMVEADNYHKRACEYLENLDLSIKRYTSTYVVAETYSWLRYRAGYPYAIAFLDVIRKTKASGALDVIFCDGDMIELAEQLLRDFSDQSLSYVDAVSMAIMKNEKINRVFGFDQHFYILNFELVPG